MVKYEFTSSQGDAMMFWMINIDNAFHWWAIRILNQEELIDSLQ